ncbi:hypothetical protein FZI91_07985 [Mycobacterium sp. CBMA271]|uniref:hypothetical protein n=1 Tax=unclassified Mycobacteroides TaxID=2618759 RepID=UPI0012DDDF15|nr:MULTISPECIES: hypothetical protein [unclassified Mycobacteroides]MUM19231.1 hypothetical protein [Mycobacteroides sp. CBMA 326]MUM21645.1 hypothetical protein [Mycobacteroides sp. CBMA 271]
MRLWTMVLTIPLVALLLQPVWAPRWGSGILGEVSATGSAAAVITVVVFFGLVALYCRTLQQILVCVPEQDRIRSPRSVWLMFAIPFNFVEDFFIVNDVAASLVGSAAVRTRSVSIWRATGLAWCSLQIVSLLPGAVGLAGGAAAILVWLGNWTHAAIITRRLRHAIEFAHG